MIATELQNIMCDTPAPLRGRVTVGVLREDEVNIVIHGHEPLLAEMIVIATQDPEMLALTRSKGAKGINVAGTCCTANEMLMGHGIPIVAAIWSRSWRLRPELWK